MSRWRRVEIYTSFLRLSGELEGPVEERLTSGQELELVVPRDKLLLFDAETEERVSP